MRKDIGGEFWEVEIGEENNLFSDKTVWFASGRAALKAVIKDIKAKNRVETVALPSWCCDSMIIPFVDEGIKVSFYPVYFEDGQLKQEINEDPDIIFVMDYFGFTSDINMESSDKIVIRDVTQSIFSKKYEDADYYFGSLRKWSGFYTGGFALKKDPWNIQLDFPEVDSYYLYLRKKAMREKATYILENKDSRKFIDIFEEGEYYLNTVKEITAGTTEDKERTKHLDIDFIKTRRQENAKFLLQNIEFDENIKPVFKEIKSEDAPLFFPILVKDRETLRDRFIENGIYSPTHWGVSIYHSVTEKERYIYDNEMSLICDQRYSVEDMKRICDIVNEWKQEKK